MEIGTSGGGCTAKTMRVISLLRSPEDAQKWGDAIVTLGSTGGMPLEAYLRMASTPPSPNVNKSDDSTSGNESEENSAAGR